MIIFNTYRIVDVESKERPGRPTEKLHIENPSSPTLKTFCGIRPWRVSEQLFVPAWDCERCYERAERKARPLPLKIKHPKGGK